MTLSKQGRGKHIDYVRTHLTRTVAAGVKRAPCSLRALARAATVNNATLVLIRQGRVPASVTVAAKVARALEAWSATCATAAADIRKALRRVPTTRTRRKTQ